MSYRLKREHLLRKRAVRDYQRALPYWVNWYVFASMTRDPVYDEPGRRNYKGPYRVPVIWIYDEEAGQELTRGGRETRRYLTLAVSVSALRNHGIDVDEVDDEGFDKRQNDMLQWDGFYWNILSVTYTSLTDMQSDPGNETYPRSDEMTARVRAVRRRPNEDMPHDTFPA